MQVPLEISFHNMDASPAVESEIRERVAKLDKLYPRLVGCRVSVELLHRQHRTGNVFDVHIELRVPGAELVVSREPHRAKERYANPDVRTSLRELVQRAGKPDVLPVDPPRAGLSQKVVRRIIEAGPRRIVYVSCNPTTLAPNAAQLTEAGYTLRRVRPVDMFPQTPHIECVALLERGG